MPSFKFFKHVTTNQNKEKQFEKVLLESCYSSEKRKEKYEIIKYLLEQGVNPNIFIGKHALVFAAYESIDLLKLIAKYMDPSELIKEKNNILEALENYLKIEVDEEGNPKYSLPLDIETNVKKAITYFKSAAFKPVGISMEFAYNRNPELEEQFKKAMSEPCYSSQKQAENYAFIKSLLDKGVNPNIFIGNHALVLAVYESIEMFMLMAKRMDPNDLIKEKNNILKTLESSLEIEVDENGNQKYSLALDFENNVKAVIAYLKGETAKSLQPKGTISRERFIALKGLLEQGWLDGAIQRSLSHPASILLVTRAIREFLSPVVIYSKSQAPQQEKNEILAILEKNATITIVGDDWLTTLKLDLMANIKNVIEYFKQETFLNEDPLKLSESDFGFSPSP